MNKNQRLSKIQEFLNDGLTADEIVEQHLDSLGVAETTLRKDIASLQNSDDEVVTNEAGEKMLPAKNWDQNIKEYPEPGPDVHPKYKGWTHPSNYMVREADYDCIHVEIEDLRISNEGKESRPTIQKYNRRAFVNFKNTRFQLGYTHAVVLHAPDGVDISLPKPEKETLVKQF